GTRREPYPRGRGRIGRLAVGKGAAKRQVQKLGVNARIGSRENGDQRQRNCHPPHKNRHDSKVLARSQPAEAAFDAAKEPFRLLRRYGSQDAEQESKKDGDSRFGGGAEAGKMHFCCWLPGGAGYGFAARSMKLPTLVFGLARSSSRTYIMCPAP